MRWVEKKLFRLGPVAALPFILLWVGVALWLMRMGAK